MTQTIKTVNGSIQIKTGTEGPHHDPYSFTKYIVDMTHPVLGLRCKVELHVGLGVQLKVNGEECDTTEDNAKDDFTKYAGMTPNRMERYFRQFESRCRHCGSDRFEAHQGYPGETLYTCCRCGQITHSDFNESAIM